MLGQKVWLCALAWLQCPTLAVQYDLRAVAMGRRLLRLRRSVTVQIPECSKLQLTVQSCSQLVVLPSLSFDACFPHVTPHLLQTSDTCLTPSTVMLLRISGDLAGEQWKKAAHERQVARRRMEHRNVLKSKKGGRHHKKVCENLDSVDRQKRL